jgi:hypothetical protein
MDVSSSDDINYGVRVEFDESTSVCMCVCIYVCMCVYVCVYMCVCVFGDGPSRDLLCADWFFKWVVKHIYI